MPSRNFMCTIVSYFSLAQKQISSHILRYPLKEGAAKPACPAYLERMLVHLVYLVYLVYLVDRTRNSSRRTRQTRKTGQPDRRARARCASTEDHQAPSPPLFCDQRGHLAVPFSDFMSLRRTPRFG